MGINWNYPTTMWIGENRIEDLQIEAKKYEKLYKEHQK